MALNSYQACLQSMFQLRRFGIKLELDTIRTILSSLSSPQESFHALHISGTNGKGSVAAMLSTILRKAGYHVGRYTSPHLERFNERIWIDDQPISDDEVVDSFQRVKTVNITGRQPTFFEFTTAMAFLSFHLHKVDWAVVETGMGGRMDATNVINPKVSIITNISLEHKEYLGPTLAAIAGEKAGIIKHRTPVVTAVKQPAAWEVIRRQAEIHGSPLFKKGRDFNTRQDKGHHLSYNGLDLRLNNLELGLHGRHQFENASLAIATCEILSRAGLAHLPEWVIRTGLKETRWPGRLELVKQNPHVILDGAHNLIGAKTLSNHLKSEFADRKITLVIGILSDKPYQAMLKDLASLCHRVVITQPKIDRAIPTIVLKEIAARFCNDTVVVQDVGNAVTYAVSHSQANDVVCIAGSLYVVGEARAALLSSGQMDSHFIV